MSTQVYQIPLDGFAESFEITLAGVTYNMTVKWNDSPDAGWVIDLFDSNSNPVVTNIPLITGDDCFDGLDYLGINGSLWVLTDQNPTAVPTFTNLGTDCNIYFQAVTSG